LSGDRPLDADEAASPFLGGHGRRPQQHLKEEAEEENPQEGLPALKNKKAPPPEVPAQCPP